MNYDNLELVKLETVKQPKLEWSCRTGPVALKSSIKGGQVQVTERLILTGLCSYQGSLRPFIARLVVTFTQSANRSEPLVNVQTDVIRVLGGEDGDQITAVQYGPYDNGYILIGLNTGKLLVFDPIDLNRMKEFNVFTQGELRGGMHHEAEAITQITIEPTELVFLTGKRGSLAGLSIVKKEMHYVYLDLGNRTYCTVAIPRDNTDDTADTVDPNRRRNQSPLRPLFDQTPTGGAICCI